ncbi:MAG: carboxypeptidase-like regulatory domain-containing protein, partial [Planctomycetota bacterium]|nr:carboxypeptidase-like regulatory domain-containing protein [Planctomycetota bacterium]
AVAAATPLAPVSFQVRHEVLAGRLLTPAGEPVDSALIFAEGGRRPSWCRSDQQGHYRLTDLLPPPWELTIIAPGFENRRLTVTEAADQTGLVLNPGPPLPEPAQVPETATSTLRGRILAAAPEDDLAGFELALLPTAGADTFGAPFTRRQRLGSDGTFELVELRAGTYRVLVLPPWARGGSWPDLTRPLDLEPRTFTHPDPTAEELMLPIVAGEIRGRILGRGQGQLAGALVTARQHGPLEPARHWPPVATEDDGSFRLRDLPPGEYSLRLRAGQGSEEQVVRVRERAVLTVDFDPVATR